METVIGELIAVRALLVRLLMEEAQASDDPSRFLAETFQRTKSDIKQASLQSDTFATADEYRQKALAAIDRIAAGITAPE